MHSEIGWGGGSSSICLPLLGCIRFSLGGLPSPTPAHPSRGGCGCSLQPYPGPRGANLAYQDYMDTLMPFTPDTVPQAERILEVFHYLVQMHDDLEGLENARLAREAARDAASVVVVARPRPPVS